jgi:hypothetical protein
VLLPLHLLPHAVLHLVEVLGHPAGKVAGGRGVVPGQVLEEIDHLMALCWCCLYLLQDSLEKLGPDSEHL